MLKRVGIATMYTGSCNYGGALQAFALIKAIKAYEYKAEQIQIVKFNINMLSKIKNILLQMIQHGYIYTIELLLKKRVKYYNSDVSENDLLLIREKFKKFRDSIPHTHQIEEEKLYTLNKEFDYFITGSDQVWTPKWMTEFPLLGFASDNKTKISYAASIGRYDFTKYEKQQLGKCVNRLQAVSVRENQAAEFIRQNYNIEAKVVLDPTMLLTAEQWEKEETKVEYPKKYIFCYFLNLNEKKRKIAQKVASILNCEIIYPLYVGQTKKYDDALKGEKLLYDVGPREWLFLIHHAEYILTDSFHGTVFSILYQKPFFHILRNSNHSKGNMNSRMDSLMKMFQLEDRYLSALTEVSKSKLQDKIDYEKVEEILEEQRKSSMEFLLSSLK